MEKMLENIFKDLEKNYELNLDKLEKSEKLKL